MKDKLSERISLYKKGIIPEGYKMTSVGIMPHEWQIDYLSKYYTKIRNGFVGTATPYYVEKGVLYLQGNNIKKGKIILDEMKYITYEFHNKQEKSILRENDIVMVQSGHVGECAVITKELDGSNCHALIVMTSKKEVESKYYSYFFNSSYGEKQFYKIKTGNTIEHILSSDMKNFRVPVPTIFEQKKIASIISTWDKAIELKEKLIEEKKKQKKGLIQKLLTGKIRIPEFKGSVEFKELEGYIKECKLRNKDNKEKKVLSVTNNQGFILQEEQFNRIVASEDLTNYKLVLKNQFAYNPSRINVGSIDLLLKYNSGLLSPMYVIFECGKGLDTNYLYHFLKSEMFLNLIPNLLQGSVRDSLSFDSLKLVKLYIPSIQEQKEISYRLNIADKEINLLEQELKALKLQKKGLMQLLLTGIVRVNTIDSE